MWKRVKLFALFSLLTLLISGCSSLWGQAKYEAVLQVQGLGVYDSVQTALWTAQSTGKQPLSGSVEVTGNNLAVPIELTSGTWQISLQLSDESGKQIYKHEQEFVVNKPDQTVVFTVEDRGTPGTPEPPVKEPPTQEPPVNQEPPETPVPPQNMWKAWNSDMQPTPTGLLQGESGYQTPYYIIDSGVAGPVLLVNGGMHGDEPAGSLAAWRLVKYGLKRGKLVVIPELNRLGLKADSRSGGYPGDPNRDYPQEQGETADDRLSRNIWQLVKDEHVTWLMDLHEGYSYHKVNSASVGQSIILHKGTSVQHASRDKVVNAMLTAANALISNADHEFSHLHNPVPGSLARAAGDYLGVAAMTIETCDKQSLSLRIQEHETMVSTAMRELGML